ncbi:hypothetical protein AC578_1876 [Pseudocercospora eumusae]|uniref:Uncharacterized protein n=1 Tax=Pseudocercospora eumusae TaxID=321146 RepID=A0A139GYH8_9PEZI|nr:hypothetical protein AC578_1876 [Pseudocercospora eumusae]
MSDYAVHQLLSHDACPRASQYARFNSVMARHAPLAAMLAQTLARALNELQSGRNSASRDARALTPRPQPDSRRHQRLPCPRCEEDFEAELPSSDVWIDLWVDGKPRGAGGGNENLGVHV